MNTYQYYLVIDRVAWYIARNGLRSAADQRSKNFLDSWNDWYTAMNKAVMSEYSRLHPGKITIDEVLLGRFELLGASGLIFENMKTWLKSKDPCFKDI